MNSMEEENDQESSKNVAKNILLKIMENETENETIEQNLLIFNLKLLELHEIAENKKINTTEEIKDPESFRKNVAKNILEKIVEDEIIAKNVEIGVFNYIIKEATTKFIVKKWDNRFFLQLYKNRLRSVYLNLKNNPTFLEKIKNGDIDPSLLSVMTHQDFCPERWEKLIELKKKKDEHKVAKNIQATTNLYVCGKCKSRNCSHTEVQIRSSDESMTIFITCIDCGNVFKQ